MRIRAERPRNINIVEGMPGSVLSRHLVRNKALENSMNHRETRVLNRLNQRPIGTIFPAALQSHHRDA